MKSSPYFLNVFELGPVAIGRLVDQIPSSRHDESLGEDRFSVREIVAHMADCEEIFSDRMKKAVAEPGVVVAPFDPGVRAAEKGYAQSDISKEMALYRERRKRTADFLKSLTEEQWQAHYSHAHWGDVTVAMQGGILVGHDMYHIEQLTAYLGGKTAPTW